MASSGILATIQLFSHKIRLQDTSSALMTISRAWLVCTQGLFYQLASTRPNKTPSKGRFDFDHPWYIRIAPTVMKLQQHAIWFCACAELLLILLAHGVLPESLTAAKNAQNYLCAPALGHSRPDIRTTSMTVVGVGLVILGSIIRLLCFRTLGPLFTFDLTILPAHNLVTWGPYAIVRHPAYTGSLLMVSGIALINFTAGSWVTECTFFGRGAAGAAARVVGGLAWLAWWIAVGITRCRSEDGELKKMFGKLWETYALHVPWWFVPGVF